jgi:hypothetical protein
MEYLSGQEGFVRFLNAAMRWQTSLNLDDRYLMIGSWKW